MASLVYFNSENDHPDLDPDGIELPDMAAAQKEALRLLGRMLQDADGDGLWHGMCQRRKCRQEHHPARISVFMLCPSRLPPIAVLCRLQTEGLSCG